MSADLGPLAHVTIEVGRSREAIDYLSQLIDQNPSLEEEHRMTFQNVFKRAVDARRRNLRDLDQPTG
jgi:hypothetical protein